MSSIRLSHTTRINTSTHLSTCRIRINKTDSLVSITQSYMTERHILVYACEYLNASHGVWPSRYVDMFSIWEHRCVRVWEYMNASHVDACEYDRVHRQCCIPEIYQIEQLTFCGISRYKNQFTRNLGLIWMCTEEFNMGLLWDWFECVPRNSSFSIWWILGGYHSLSMDFTIWQFPLRMLLPQIHQIYKVGILGISWYKYKVRVWFNLNLYWEM